MPYVDVKSQDWVLPASALQARHLCVQLVVGDILALALAAVVALGLMALLLGGRVVVGRLGMLLGRRLRVAVAIGVLLGGVVGKRMLGCLGVGVGIRRLRREGLGGHVDILAKGGAVSLGGRGPGRRVCVGDGVIHGAGGG